MEKTTEFSSDLTQNELSNIYIKLSISEDTNFEDKNNNCLVIDIIEKIFTKKHLQIETKLLQEDSMLLNNMYLTLIKSCGECRFKKPAIIFISFCDYFDLEYNKTFLLLHDKLQMIIKINTKMLIGDVNYQKKQRQQNNGLHIPTLFDLIRK